MWRIINVIGPPPPSSRVAAVDGGSSTAAGVGWYKALDSSQEVLVWVGKFLTSEMPSEDGSGTVEYYGAELPIIKTLSMICKSPRYLAELLMD